MTGTEFYATIDEFFDIVDNNRCEICMVFEDVEDIDDFFREARHRGYRRTRVVADAVYSDANPLEYVLFAMHARYGKTLRCDYASKVSGGYWKSVVKRLETKCFMCDNTKNDTPLLFEMGDLV